MLTAPPSSSPSQSNTCMLLSLRECPLSFKWRSRPVELALLPVSGQAFAGWLFGLSPVYNLEHSWLHWAALIRMLLPWMSCYFWPDRLVFMGALLDAAVKYYNKRSLPRVKCSGGWLKCNNVPELHKVTQRSAILAKLCHITLLSAYLDWMCTWLWLCLPEVTSAGFLCLLPPLTPLFVCDSPTELATGYRWNPFTEPPRNFVCDYATRR